MSKIDMTTKFFHGIAWREDSNAYRISLLKEILKDGKILSPRDVDIKNGFIPISSNDNIFLSVYPYGIYSSEYLGDDHHNGMTGFEMTTDTFYFILSRKIISDFNVYSGAYPLECVVNEPIDLKKYLVGVGNAGYNINSDLIMCYYYTKYLKGHISQDILLNKIRNYLCPGLNYFQIQDNQAILKIINSWVNIVYHDGYTEYRKTIESVRGESAEHFIKPGAYYDIKRVFDENGFPIRFYDFAGYSVEPERQQAKVRRMQKYILGNAVFNKR